jgi:NAD(P)-dependent dehydrogenase (short-subunit alcohol dehydrogenase family)
MAMKRILITGAGTGFGRGAALGLAEKGHDVIAAVYDPKQISEIKREAAVRGVSLRAEKLDLLSESDRQAAFEWDIDVLVNNAAIGESGPIGEIPLELVRRVFDVNVFAAALFSDAVLCRFRLLPASIAGTDPRRGSRSGPPGRAADHPEETRHETPTLLPDQHPRHPSGDRREPQSTGDIG